MAQPRAPFANVKEGDVEFVDVASRKKRAPFAVAGIVVALVVAAFIVIPQVAGTSATPTTPGVPQGMTPVIVSTTSENASDAATSPSAASASPDAAAASSSSAAAPAEGQIAIALVVDGSDADWGIMFDGTVHIAEGGNVYDALKASNLNVSTRQALGMGAYITAINGLAEKSAGPTSGWLFYINDKLSSQSSDKVVLNDGDSVRWVWRADATNVRS